MNQFIPHHSTANNSDICRWSIDVRYQVTGQPSGRDWQPTTILTGPDECGLEAWEQGWKECRENGNMRAQHRVAK
jgi:hypothetical protein